MKKCQWKGSALFQCDYVSMFENFILSAFCDFWKCINFKENCFLKMKRNFQCRELPFLISTIIYFFDWSFPVRFVKFYTQARGVVLRMRWGSLDKQLELQFKRSKCFVSDKIIVFWKIQRLNKLQKADLKLRYTRPAKIRQPSKRRLSLFLYKYFMPIKRIKLWPF